MGHRRAGARRGVAVALAFATVTTLAACGGDDAEPVADPVQDLAEPAAEPEAGAAGDGVSAADQPAYGLVTPEQAVELANDADVTVIDVRTPDEYAEGHIEGARLIDLSSTTFADDVAALDPDGEYLVYCRSGNRSAQAVDIMAQLGVTQVWDMEGGVIAYAQAGLPLVR